MNVVKKHVNGLRMGEIQLYKSIGIAPLIASDSSLDHIVLSDALNQGFKITEKKEGASVPFLHVVNQSGKYVLAIAGEYVVGGLQNRTLMRNIYFDKNFEGDIPVRCIEQGRWNQPVQQEPEEEPMPLPPEHPDVVGPRPRRKERQEVPVFRAEGHTPVSALYCASDQAETWGEIHNLMSTTRTKSFSRNLGDIYRQRRADLEEYIKNFPIIDDNQVGVLVIISKDGRKIFNLDLFDRKEIFGKHHRNLISSYAVESGLKENGTAELTKKEAQGFLSCIEDYTFSRQQSIGSGEDYLLSRGNFEGSTLVFNKGFVYLNLHSKREDKPRDLDISSLGDVLRPQTGFGREF
ncbi:MAG: DUF6569 family protein [Nanoarchaeota archaeon]